MRYNPVMKRTVSDRGLIAGIACSVALISIPALTHSPLTSMEAGVLQSFAAVRSTQYIEFFSYVTMLGSTALVAAFTLCAALLLSFFARRGKALSFGLLIAVGGAALTEVILKDLIARERPLGALVHESTYSFPSGHASVSLALFGFLALCVYHLIEHKTYRAVLMAVLIGTALLIASSRVYLGIHYPTDVLAGLGIGALWVIVGADAVRRVRKSAL